MVKWLFLILGWFFVALAAVGVLLPGLPTVPFLLVAAGCFAKCSPRFHGWLLNNRVFGPILADWERSRTIPRRAKYLAIGSMMLMGSVSVLILLNNIYLQSVIIALVLIGTFYVARIPESGSLVAEKVDQ